MNSKLNKILERLREILANVSIKTYLYGIGAVAMIILIILNTNGGNKYIIERNDGKVDLPIDRIAKDYGLNLNENSDENNLDYINSDNNLTNDLSKSLLLTSMFLNQNGMTDSEAKGKILANIVYEYQKAAEGKVYTENDLNVIRNTDRASLREYFQDIDDAVGKYIKSSQDIPTLETFNTLNPDSSITDSQLLDLKGGLTANILKNIEINNNFINNLVSIPATSDGAIYQLQLINLISKTNAFLKSLAYIDTDPAKYLLLEGDKFETNYNTDLLSVINSFNNYFKINKALPENN